MLCTHFKDILGGGHQVKRVQNCWGSAQVGDGYQSADTCKSGRTVIGAGQIAITEADEAPVTHVSFCDALTPII